MKRLYNFNFSQYIQISKKLAVNLLPWRHQVFENFNIIQLTIISAESQCGYCKNVRFTREVLDGPWQS